MEKTKIISYRSTSFAFLIYLEVFYYTFVEDV
jgi:hypothetical protein